MVVIAERIALNWLYNQFVQILKQPDMTFYEYFIYKRFQGQNRFKFQLFLDDRPPIDLTNLKNHFNFVYFHHPGTHDYSFVFIIGFNSCRVREGEWN